MADHEAVADFIGAMEAAGINPVEPVAQRLGGGSLIRFRSEGDKPGRQNGWAILHLDGRPAGAFGNYRLGISERWRSGAGSAAILTPEERRARATAWRKAAEAKQAAIENGWASAAAYGERLWSEGKPALEHRYLTAKGISGEGMRVRDGALLVPMRDIFGTLWNVQRIWADGKKRFLTGGKTAGLMWLCGEPDAAVCIGEGVSTMAVVRRATGFAVVAAFSEKNLTPTAKLVAGAYPDKDLIICADDDAHLVEHPTIKRNLGLDAANAAALAVGGRVAVPPRSARHG